MIDEDTTRIRKYQKSMQELLSKLKDQHVDLIREQSNDGNELKYLEYKVFKIDENS